MKHVLTSQSLARQVLEEMGRSVTEVDELGEVPDEEIGRRVPTEERPEAEESREVQIGKELLDLYSELTDFVPDCADLSAPVTRLKELGDELIELHSDIKPKSGKPKSGKPKSGKHYMPAYTCQSCGHSFEKEDAVDFVKDPDSGIELPICPSCGVDPVEFDKEENK